VAPLQIKNLEKGLQSLLDKRESEGTLRALTLPRNLIDFYSNDYLGFSRSEELFQRISERASELPHFVGATGSRLLSGNSSYAEEVENKLSNFFCGQSATIFNSGYAANLGVLSSIPQRGDTILYDELSHASLKDGARLSLAKRFPFRHNDLNDLESKLKISSGNIYIVVESVYSMDGDLCPLNELILLSKQYNAFIILDEAHSTGIFGEKGNGIANHLKCVDDISIRIYTFGKALGCHGACVIGSETLKNFLVNYSRPFIYSTALPFHSLAAIECAIDFLTQNLSLKNLLFEKIKLFNELMEKRHSNPTPIQTTIFQDAQSVKKISSQLQESGFDLRAIVAPTVPKGKERLRICLHAFNDDTDVRRLCQLINDLTA
jgi:8-amino-7-oxononanoate synthase